MIKINEIKEIEKEEYLQRTIKNKELIEIRDKLKEILDDGK